MLFSAFFVLGWTTLNSKELNASQTHFTYSFSEPFCDELLPCIGELQHFRPPWRRIDCDTVSSLIRGSFDTWESLPSRVRACGKGGGGRYRFQNWTHPEGDGARHMEWKARTPERRKVLVHGHTLLPLCVTTQAPSFRNHWLFSQPLCPLAPFFPPFFYITTGLKTCFYRTRNFLLVSASSNHTSSYEILAILLRVVCPLSHTRCNRDSVAVEF